jgi:hypothetical protein
MHSPLNVKFVNDVFFSLSCPHNRALVTKLLHTHPTNALYMLTPHYSQLPFYMFQPSRGPSSGSTDTFREQGQQNTRAVCYVAFCKLLRNTQHAAL